MSNDDKIQVKLSEPVIKNNPNVRLNKLNNIEFNLNIPPLQSVDLLIKYKFKYPRNKDIEFL